jgi:hypothetical protein
MMPPPNIGRRIPRAAIPVLVLVLVFLVDLLLDIRDRDAFTWMDPHQYLDAARGVAAGTLDRTTFALPSIFPWLVAPFLLLSDTVAGALLVQVPALTALVAGTWWLHRRMVLPGPAWLPTFLVLSAPVTLGLSRELYAEVAVAAVTVWGMAAWWSVLHAGGRRSWWALLAVTTFGILLKVSYPLALLGPVAVGLGGLFRERRTSELGRAGLAYALGGAAAVAVFAVALPGTAEYLITVGHTTIPDMRVVGPPEVLSLGSLAYYPYQLAVSLLGVALVLVPVGGRRLLGRDRSLLGPGALLLAWLLAPMVLLILQPVKEPRYVYSVIVPAALLATAGWPSGAGAGARAARVGLSVAAVAFFLDGRMGFHGAPYYLRGPIAAEALVDPVRRADLIREPYLSTPPEGKHPHWAITQSVLLDGFEANHALALTWALRTAVVVDLGSVDRTGIRVRDLAYHHFVDLFMMASFSTYNRRCRWPEAYATLSRDELIEGASLVLVRGDDAARDRWRALTADHVHTLEVGGSPVHVFRGLGQGGETYRERYAHRFEARVEIVDGEDRGPLGKELAYMAILRGASGATERVLRAYPRALAPARNIYWLRSYQPIHQLLVPRLLRRTGRRLQPGPP